MCIFTHILFTWRKKDNTVRGDRACREREDDKVNENILTISQIKGIAERLCIIFVPFL